MLRSVISIICLCFFAGSVQAKDSFEKIEFNYAQSGIAYNLARIALRDQLSPIEQDMNRRMVLFTARQDLNGDNTPEVIVRLSDKQFFCAENKGCKTYVLAISNNAEPQKIAEFYADDVFLSNLPYNGARKIETAIAGRSERKAYMWNQGEYSEVK